MLKYAVTYVQTIYYQVVVTYFPTYLLIYDLFLIEWVIVKPNINSIEVHAQLNHDKHPMDGVLVVTSSLWPIHLVFDDRLLT
jgi:hypothetical protein